MKSLKSCEEVRKEFRYRGLTISNWSRANGFNPDSVKKVLAGKLVGNWGKAHEIAVKLGIKDGVISK